MSQANTTYKRVDVERMQERAPAAAASTERAAAGVRWLIIPISIALCIFQSMLTVTATHRFSIYPASTMIPVLAFGVLFLLVLIGNPLLRFGRGISLAAAAVVTLLAAGLAWAYWDPTVSNEAWARLDTYVNIVKPLRYVVRYVVFFLDLLFGASGLPKVAMLFAALALVFALLRLCGFRPFNRGELIALFCAMMVTSGIATFGLADQLVPLVATPNNAEWKTPQRGWDDPLIANMRKELYLPADAIGPFREGAADPATGKPFLAPKDGAGFVANVTYWKKITLAVPWAAWISPLFYWLILVFGCYGMFYFLTYVVLGYWSDREKLIFPLAKLPESLLPAPGSSAMPVILRTPGFWAGFVLSAGVLAWNAFSASGFIGGADWSIPMGMSRYAFDAMVNGTPWAGLGTDIQFGTRFFILFTAIGIAFLLPLEISFSVWFYYLIGRAIILIHVWMGFGRNGDDFPSDWLWFNSPVTAQGGGGLMLFSALSLYRCLRDYARLVAGRSFRDRLRIGAPVVGLVVCMAIVTGWLTWNRMPIFWALVIILLITLLTLGLMRIVAEGGVYWFQSHTSFFHMYKMLGLGKFLAAPLVGPLIPIYSVLFLDIKTFMAPNLLNAGVLNKGHGHDRTKFHVNLVLCIVVSVVVSLGFSIFLAHMIGAQQMNSWFYSAGPMSMMDTARDATRTVAEFNPSNTTWWGLGAGWVALSMYLRTWLFWFPHPIGYIMLINPLMAQLWFSFFIGWVCKKGVVRYGGKLTFDKVRTVFIGLILGELLSVFGWSMASLFSTAIKASSISLNRY